MNTKKLIFVLLLSLFPATLALAQSNTDKVRQFERLLREWKSAGFSTGSETYTRLKSMTTEGCKMSERIAKAYNEDYNSSAFDIRVNTWFQYVKEKQISISLRDLYEKIDDDRRTIVYCRITYTQPGKQDREDFVGFKFDGGKIFYIFNDDRERANRIRSDNERNVVENKPSASEQPQQKTAATSGNGMFDGHEYVNLGLPSGTLWATTNIGANNPEDYGDYFAWGETSPKSNYDWSTYKYANGASNKLTKYNTKSNYGSVDNKITLDRSDDVAYQKWGSDWCMPTQAQFQELKDKCKWTWTTRNGKNGYEVKGPNGNTIFLPAAGYKGLSGLSDAGSYGYYWSSSLNTDSPSHGRSLGFDSGRVYTDGWDDRSCGDSVRAVRCRN